MSAPLATDGTVRRLPLGIAPYPGESLAGYVMALAQRVGLTVAELGARTGLTPSAAVSIPPSYALHLPLAEAARLRQATGLTPAELHRLLLASYDGLLFRLQPSADTPALPGTTPLTRSWCSLGRRAACPDCLADAERDGKAAWRLAWQTPWSFACVRHRRLLQHLCPACGAPVGSGHRHGLVPNSHSDVPPTSCRARPGGTPCGRPLGRAPGDPEPGDPGDRLLAVQAGLDRLLAAADTAGPMPRVHSLGVDITAEQLLRDARLLALLADAGRGWQDLQGLPADVAGAVRNQAALREGQTRSRDSRREWYAPPATPALAAALLVPALELLAQPVSHAAEEIDRVAAAARQHEHLLFNRARFTSGASVRLLALLTPASQRRFTPGRLRDSAGNTTSPALRAEHVPACLPEHDRQTHFAWYTGSPKTLRRAVPLLVVRLLNDCPLDEAADFLGVPATAAVMAVARARRAVAAPGQDHRLREAVAHLADAWSAKPPPDFAARRRALTDYELDTPAWQRITSPLREAEAARSGKRIDWNSRREPAAAIVWGIVTCGEAVYSPAAARHDGPRFGTHLDAARRQLGLLPALTLHAQALAAALDGPVGGPATA